MKKYILIISIFILPLLTNAQKGIPDFTITDIYGNKHELIKDYLDKGKYVFIDFFTTSCGSCETLATKADTVFRDFGCNYGDIIFLGIDAGYYNPYGTDSSVWEFTRKFNMKFPAISGIDGGGRDVFVEYGYDFTPYKILISDNKEIVTDDMIIREASDLRDSLLTFGLSMQACEGNDFMFFSLISATDSIVGELDENNKTISVEFSSKTDLTSLRANYREGVNSVVKINGEIQENGITVNDFSSPITYEITSENGISETWTVSVSSTANVDFLNKKFNVYPNPTEEIVILENTFYTSNSNVKVSISDISGKVYKVLNLNKQDEILDFSNYPKGIYFINIETNDGIASKKIVLF